MDGPVHAQDGHRFRERGRDDAAMETWKHIHHTKDRAKMAKTG